LIENALGIGQLIVEEAQWMGVTGLYTYMSRMMRLKREREEGGAEFYRVGILTEAHFTVESGLSRFFLLWDCSLHRWIEAILLCVKERAPRALGAQAMEN
jgi:hypothetical protein